MFSPTQGYRRPSDNLYWDITNHPYPTCSFRSPMWVTLPVWTQPTSHTGKPDDSQKLKGQTQAVHRHTNLSLYRHSPQGFLGASGDPCFPISGWGLVLHMPDTGFSHITVGVSS